jgi:gentisate 1,2-dioxygenase
MVGNEPHSLRARFLPVEEGFNISRPALEACSFDSELSSAFDRDAASGFTLLDKSNMLSTPFPATSPLLLAKFLRLNRGDCLFAQANASGEIYYVVCGSGHTEWENDALHWRAGDIFCLPGGLALRHSAEGLEDCILYVVTDEPMLAFERVRPEVLSSAPIEPVHYPAGLIAAQLAALFEREIGPETAGRALFLTSARMAEQRTCLPSLTLTLNAVLTGERQRPHKHNAAAIVFIVKEGSVHSCIGNRSFPWRQNAVILTPANAVHSHVNTGSAPAVALIVQDGGLHYHCRTMGFEFS